jgi:glycolate oxidase FAD binding subunit
LTIDGIEPSKVVRPGSVEELSQLLSQEKGAIVPIGTCTQTSYGNPLRRADCAVDLTGLSRITEYVPSDLTVHVEAGVTLEQLHHTLVLNNQFLPLDPWNGPKATLGGLAATNAQGPFRGVGTIRDWVIGMKVVEVDGRITKAGGRVVKNVTGYDLHKLYTGSLGSLAIIVEISLKLRAKFACTATAIAHLADQETAAACIAAVRNSGLQPVACEWLGPENEVWLRFGEDSRAVEWQLDHLPPAATWIRLDGPEESAAWERLRNRYNSLGGIVVRVVGMPTAVREIIDVYRPSAWVAHALNGIVLMQISSAEEILHLRRQYRVVVEKAPSQVRREVPAFGLTDVEFDLMKRMKDTFDPEGRLNPGRHVDGERRF